LSFSASVGDFKRDFSGFLAYRSELVEDHPGMFGVRILEYKPDEDELDEDDPD